MMCGRFVLKAPPAELITHFGLDECADFKPRYNAATTQMLPIVHQSIDGTTNPYVSTMGSDPELGQAGNEVTQAYQYQS